MNINRESAMINTNKNVVDSQLRKVQEVLLAITLDTKECLLNPQNIARLSPTEKCLKNKLLAR